MVSRQGARATGVTDAVVVAPRRLFLIAHSDAHATFVLHSADVHKPVLDSSKAADWWTENSNKIGCLTQGHAKNNINRTNTVHFIFPHEVSKGKIPTCLKIVAANRPAKANPKRVRWTAGGNRTVHLGDKSTKTADTFKLLANSVISTDKAQFMSIDIKNFHLNTPLLTHEHVEMPIKNLPADIVESCNLEEIFCGNFIHVKICKKHVSNDRLVQHLARFGCRPAKHTSGLFIHDTNSVTFALVVDNFGVKHTDPANA